MNDELLKHFLELQQALADKGVPIILGGGMSLYINLTYKNGDNSRYPFGIKVRPTNDLDIFLTADLIADTTKYENIKKTLEQTLGYKVVETAKWFQFKKEIDLYGISRIIKIDLLSAPPKESDLSKVNIKVPRVRPRSAKNIHAFLTNEAKGLEIGKQIINLPDGSQTITIVSNFNYLIFKLHAFVDTLEDAKKDYGRHHALDLFYTVARMVEKDWENARNHYELHSREDYLINACKIRKDFFSTREQFGIIRLAENQAYTNNSKELSAYLDQFLKDLLDLFPGGSEYKVTQ